MTNAISTTISIIGPGYFQPIADLIGKMISKEKDSYHEQGYSAALIILIVSMLESFAMRIKFFNQELAKEANSNIPDLLLHIYPNLPNHQELVEIFQTRNAMAHNHVWHLTNPEQGESATTINNPKELGTSTNRNYDGAIDLDARKTKLLGLNVSPGALNREDVLTCLTFVWSTLVYLNQKDFGLTPLSNDDVAYESRKIEFSSLIDVLRGAL